MPGGAYSDAADPEFARIEALADARKAEPGPLIEILHDIQHEFGYLPEATTPVVGEVLNLSRAEVHGVISFYTDFRTEAPAEVTVAICRGESLHDGCRGPLAHATLGASRPGREKAGCAVELLGLSLGNWPSVRPRLSPGRCAVPDP